MSTEENWGVLERMFNPLRSTPPGSILASAEIGRRICAELLGIEALRRAMQCVLMRGEGVGAAWSLLMVVQPEAIAAECFAAVLDSSRPDSVRWAAVDLLATVGPPHPNAPEWIRQLLATKEAKLQLAGARLFEAAVVQGAPAVSPQSAELLLLVEQHDNAEVRLHAEVMRMAYSHKN